MTPESLFELIGFLGSLVAIFFFSAGGRRTLMRNGRRAFAIVLVISAVKYLINAAEWSGLLGDIQLDQMEDYLDDIWPFAWFLFFFAAVNDASARRFARDAERRKKTERRLRESEDKFFQLFNTSPIWNLLSTVDEGRLIEANDVFFRKSGYERDESIGRTTVEIGLWQHPKDREEISDLLRKKRKINAHPVRFRMKDGKMRDFLWSAVVISIEGEDCLLNAMVDVTRLKRAEEEKAELEKQIVSSQKMEALGTLAGGIAHDFNNLLMGIQGRTSIILAAPDIPPSIEKDIGEIEEHVKSGARLTRQLLGYARGGKYEVEDTAVNDLVEKTLHMFGRTRKEIEIRVKPGEDLWPIRADQSQIEQVLLNIFINAWQAMPGGGTLSVETKNTVLDEQYVKGYDVVHGDYVQIAIADSGTGMDGETKERLFEPFFTTKKVGKGTGLGLASVYGIVKNHRGMITVYSELGHGTTFNLYFPAVEKAEPRRPAPVQRKQADFVPGQASGKILMVDDEPHILKVGTKMLELLGYEVKTAGKWTEALKTFGQDPSDVDLVIIDMIMPEMGGGDLFVRLRDIDPGVKVLLSSGYSIDGQASRILDQGCNGFIQKPFSMRELADKVKEILEG